MLYPLGEAGVSVPPAAREVRGWPVRTLVDARVAGTVHDLLAEANGTVRYLDLVLEGGKHVLLPIGLARADLQDTVVWAPGLTAVSIARLPAYDHSAAALTPEVETELLEAYTSVLAGGAPVDGWGAPGPPPAPLTPLSELKEYVVAQGEPDPRGWRLLGYGDAPLGSIQELLVDPAALKVRFLVAVVGGGGDPQPGVRRILVPIAAARLDPSRSAVTVEDITGDDLDRLPTYDGQPLSAEDEADIRHAFAAARPRALHDDPRFDPRVCFPPEPA